MKEKFTKGMGELADLALKYSGVHREYSDEDLGNAVFILTEVLLAKTHDYHGDKLNRKDMLFVAKELGKSLHQTVEVFSGVDLHKSFK